MTKKELEILDLLRKATESGKIKWQSYKESYDNFVTKYKTSLCKVTFLYICQTLEIRESGELIHLFNEKTDGIEELDFAIRKAANKLFPSEILLDEVHGELSKIVNHPPLTGEQCAF